jgi:CRP/FNR family transcriptional regulator
MGVDESRFKRTVIESCLRSSQLLLGLPAEDIQSIAAMVIPKRLAKGDYLFRQGDPAEGFYIVQRGAINVHRVSSLGKEQVIHVFRPVESFAEASLAAPAGYPADARAMTASSVLLVPKRDFVQLLSKRPELALRMLGSLSQHLRVLVALVDDFTLKDIETRLANWLLKRCPQPIADAPQMIQLEATKRVLASEMGTTSETLSRTLAKFRKLKLLRMSGTTITITQPRELQRLLQRHLGEL